MSDIKTICDSGSHTLVLFKSRESGQVFENYLASLGVYHPIKTRVRDIKEFTIYLEDQSENLVGYSYIYARYVPKQYIEDFKQLMED